MENKKDISPSQYFEYVKGAKNQVSTESLKQSYDVFIKLAEKYNKLGQVESMKRLCFLADVMLKEEKLIEIGVTTFIYKDVIEDYIENVAGKVVKIVELSRYMREIPDELVDVVEKSRELFDEFYVLFTDYTGKEERKVAKERREKDPILFGVFKNGGNVADRFYFIGDWIDEYCDLTLDKMVDEYKSAKGYSPVIVEKIPESGEELVEILKTYKTDDKKDNIIIGNNVAVNMYSVDRSSPKQKSFFDKIRSFLKR